MYEGFSDYEVFIDSISDGFTNALNEYREDDLLCNSDGFVPLHAAFGEPLTTAQMRAVNDKQLTIMQATLDRSCSLRLTKPQILDCLRAALNQSVGSPKLDNY